MNEMISESIGRFLSELIKINKERNEIERRKVKAIEERNEIEQEKLSHQYGDSEPKSLVF